MDEILEKIKKLEAPQIIVFALCGIAFSVLCYGIFSGDEDTVKTSSIDSLELPEDGRPVTNYKSKMEAYGVQEEKGSSIELDFSNDFFSKDSSDTYDKENEEKMAALKEQIENIESKKESGIYGEENSKEIKDLQKQIEDEKPKHVVTKQTSQTNYPGTPKLSYEEKLMKAREALLGNETTVQPNTSNNSVTTRFAIFRDQFKLPGELVELVLTKSFTYDNKKFEKGTPVYAYINIEQSRVLFDITNIAHEPLSMEVRDIRDGRLGMYSTRAGELWKQYEAEGINKTTESVAQEITNNGILSKSIDAISKFFQKHRLRDNEKIGFLNDQELIVTIKPRKQ